MAFDYDQYIRGKLPTSGARVHLRHRVQVHPARRRHLKLNRDDIAMVSGSGAPRASPATWTSTRCTPPTGGRSICHRLKWQSRQARPRGQRRRDATRSAEPLHPRLPQEHHITCSSSIITYGMTGPVLPTTHPATWPPRCRTATSTRPSTSGTGEGRERASCPRHRYHRRARQLIIDAMQHKGSRGRDHQRMPTTHGRRNKSRARRHAPVDEGHLHPAVAFDKLRGENRRKFPMGVLYKKEGSRVLRELLRLVGRLKKQREGGRRTHEQRYEIRFPAPAGRGDPGWRHLPEAGPSSTEERGAEPVVRPAAAAPPSRRSSSRQDDQLPKGDRDRLMLALTQEACMKYYKDIKRTALLMWTRTSSRRSPKDVQVLRLPIIRTASEEIGKASWRTSWPSAPSRPPRDR